MAVSYELLKRELMKVEWDEELDKFGFGHFESLTDRYEGQDYYERLWISKNKEGKEIVIADNGNTNITVIAFLDEFINEKKVFDPESFGHLPTYSNKAYHKEVDEGLAMAFHIIEPEKEGVVKLVAHKSKNKG